MEPLLPQPSSSFRTLIAFCGSICIAALIFLLIPITQEIGNQNRSVITFRETSVTLVPPTPPAAPEAPEPVETEEAPPTPEFEKDFSELSLNQLELSLNPGIGDALAIGITGGGFETQVDTIGDIEKIFTFSDLAQSPSIINQPRIDYPRELSRRGIMKGTVVALIEIQPSGKAVILKIISTTHPQLVKTAKDAIRQAHFTKPKVDGVSRTVRGEWPINFRAPQ